MEGDSKQLMVLKQPARWGNALSPQWGPIFTWAGAAHCVFSRHWATENMSFPSASLLCPDMTKSPSRMS